MLVIVQILYITFESQVTWVFIIINTVYLMS